MRSRVSVYGATLVLAVLATAAVLWTFLHRAPPLRTPAASATSTAATSNPQPSNTTAYQSQTYQFSLFYPNNLTVSEQPGASGSMVVLFEDRSSGQGFDVFIDPYLEPKITQATFLMDEPSGVMEDPQNIIVDGAPATTFFSTNQAMGASVEIWLLNNGLLYEITAPQPLASWLLQIMETWQFT